MNLFMLKSGDLKFRSSQKNFGSSILNLVLFNLIYSSHFSKELGTVQDNNTSSKKILIFFFQSKTKINIYAHVIFR
jgi:hypothetical protein